MTIKHLCVEFSGNPLYREGPTFYPISRTIVGRKRHVDLLEVDNCALDVIDLQLGKSESEARLDQNK